MTKQHRQQVNNIVLCPSCSGKSHLAANDPLFKDGDHIIRDEHGWPPGRWWETLTDPEIDAVHVRNWTTIVNWADAHPTRIVLFNGRVPIAAIQPVMVVIPPDAVLLRNARTRAKLGVVNQPSDPDAILSSANKLYEYALSANVPLIIPVTKDMSFDLGLQIRLGLRVVLGPSAGA